jgi:hypothetical protein
MVMSRERERGRELEPRRVRFERVERQVRRAGRFQRLDPVLDHRMLAVGGLKRGDVLVDLVGDEALKAMPVQIGVAELRAGVRSLTAADQPGAVGPIGEVDRAGQLIRSVSLQVFLG